LECAEETIELGVESEILSYLETYGNTREKDLLSYGVEYFGLPSDQMKRILDRMAVKDRIHRIVHNKLKPAEVYITLEEPLPPEARVDREVTQGEVKRILQEAASLADHITKNGFR
jgi:hypothetical protein